MLRWLVGISATLAVLLLAQAHAEDWKLGPVHLTGTVLGWRLGMPNPCFPTAANPY